MTNAMKTALDAAMQFCSQAVGDFTDDKIIETAKKFYRELFVTAPGAAEEWSEDWFNRVHVWLRTLSGDQLGSVSGALKNVTSEREMMARGAMQDWPNVEGPLPQEPSTEGRMHMNSIPLTQVARHVPVSQSCVGSGSQVPVEELERQLNGDTSASTDPLDVLPQLGVDVRHEGQVREALTGKTHAVPPGVWTRLPGVAGQVFNETGKTVLVMIGDSGTVQFGAPMKWRPNAAEGSEFVGPLPPVGPVLAPGQELRIRPLGADPYTTATVVAKLEHDNAEGFRAFVPQGAFSEAVKDQIEENSARYLLKVLAPARLRGTIVEQIKELVGTAQKRLEIIERFENEQDKREGELREILGALPGYGDHDTGNFVSEETSIDAARRVMKELGVARARLRDRESE